MGINEIITYDVYNYIADISSNGKSGARDLRNNIRKKIEDVIVDMIIENGDGGLKYIEISVENGQLYFSKKDKK